MKQSIKSYVLGGAFFGAVMAIVFSLNNGIIIGIISGIFAGVLFALLLALFIHCQTKKFQLIKQEMLRDHTIIYDGGANHFKGKEGVGGWLFLSDKEIIFRSHNFNFQNHILIIPSHDIADITKKNNLGLIPNGIVIRTKDGKTERFVVHGRDIWIQKIKQSMNPVL